MNRRVIGGIGLLVALALFAAPLVSPIPDQKPHVRVQIDSPSSEPLPLNEYGLETTYRYQNLSAPAQHFFDTQTSSDSVTLLLPREVPAPWAPPGNVTAAAIVNNSGQVIKDGQYYGMYFGRTIPQPPFVAVVLRFGALVGAISLGTLAGYFALTPES